MRNMLRQLLNEQAQKHRQDVFMKYLLKKRRRWMAHFTDTDTFKSWVTTSANGVGYQMGSYEESALIALMRNFKPEKPVYYYRIVVEANERVKIFYDPNEDYEYQEKVVFSEFAMYSQYTEEELPKYFQSVTDFSRDTRAWQIVEYAPHGDAKPGYRRYEIQSMQVKEKIKWD